MQVSVVYISSILHVHVVCNKYCGSYANAGPQTCPGNARGLAVF